MAGAQPHTRHNNDPANDDLDHWQNLNQLHTDWASRLRISAGKGRVVAAAAAVTVTVLHTVPRADGDANCVRVFAYKTASTLCEESLAA